MTRDSGGGGRRPSHSSKAGFTSLTGPSHSSALPLNSALGATATTRTSVRAAVYRDQRAGPHEGSACVASARARGREEAQTAEASPRADCTSG